MAPNQQEPLPTVVTACDANFLWGIFLLSASMRRHRVRARLQAHLFDFSDPQRALIEQFDHVQVFASVSQGVRNITCEKPAALVHADSEVIAWIDSDCLVTGDISPHLQAAPGTIQVRLREPQEVAYLFRSRYAPGETRGPVPAQVLELWQRDVAQRPAPAITQPCNACCFVFNRTELPFIRHWKSQIEKVIPVGDKGMFDDRNIAYFMLDEAVLSSLLLYAAAAPRVTDYQLLDTASAGVIHWGGSPKPWVRWMLRNLKDFDAVVSTIEWAVAQGYRTPPVPWHLRRGNRLFCYLAASLFELRRKTLFRLKELVKRRVKRP